ncbi:hypothetical protein B0A52_10388 [Exophiala mesophila]|uniref:Uncharacterized protein n=1 Tax=Exophiala mesophila TaxID=212818 RepID=A0A438MQ81_EXOME|nr:hypothetical protein B0A52_10388 [Exophiala mesophila]
MWPELTGDYIDIPEDLQNALQMAIGQDSNAFSALSWEENSYLPTHNGLLWDGPLPDPVAQQQLSYHTPQIGSNAYASIEHAGPVLIRGPHGILHKTNSSWSDHITTVEYFLRLQWANLIKGKRKKALMTSSDSLSSSASFMLSSFICLAWPTMAAWHTYTKAHMYVGSLMAWRLNPTDELFASIDPAFRPTKLQLTVPHPAIIDWIPLSSLRDKLILFYSASPSLDELVCEVGNAYVMEGDLSRLIAGLPPTRGYVGVWDLVRAIAPEAATASNNSAPHDLSQTNFDRSPETVDDFDGDEVVHHTTLPARDVTALFNSKVLALKAFKMMRMHTGPGNFLLDPAFFERHPELYDPGAGIIAKGVPLRPGDRKLIVTPQPMDAGVLGRYRELSSWSITLSSPVVSAS